jgi:hypothetical protein
MCSHYEGVKDPQALREVFQVEPPALTEVVKLVVA